MIVLMNDQAPWCLSCTLGRHLSSTACVCEQLFHSQCSGGLWIQGGRWWYNLYISTPYTSRNKTVLFPPCAFDISTQPLVFWPSFQPSSVVMIHPLRDPLNRSCFSDQEPRPLEVVSLVDTMGRAYFVYFHSISPDTSHRNCGNSLVFLVLCISLCRYRIAVYSQWMTSVPSLKIQ